MTKKIKTQRQFTYSALMYSQRNVKGAPEFVVFHAPAREIVEWADVHRLTPESRTGAQRPLKDLKVKKVSKFIRADPANTIPTSIIVALDPASVKFNGEGDMQAGKVGEVTINARIAKPGLIIDGQHRVHGAAAELPDMHLNIVAFLGNDDSERAFQFVVINNTASRISRDHIQALNLQFDKDELNGRLISSSGVGLGMAGQKYDDLQVVDVNEPFRGLLKYPTNAKGFIPPSAIESALAETYERSALLGIDGDELELFLSIWSTIKDLRGNAWRAGDSKLLQKVGIYALTVYLLESMISRQRNSDDVIDFSNTQVLEEQVNRVVGRIPEQFWTMEWKSKEMDTSSGRAKLIETLEIIDSNARFNRPWYERVSFVDANQVVESGGASNARAKATKKTARKLVKKAKVPVSKPAASKKLAVKALTKSTIAGKSSLSRSKVSAKKVLKKAGARKAVRK
ncbi:MULTISPECIES: DGQHR domain-containing protein [Stenotrophomonas]|jgi:DGQHR domain-containing protein|uniref:DGQHR domain-containing protein n=1 Tax=Stenotrophomonas TaxID=40323 RepID=UPI000C16111B|nr:MULTISPECIES: DGQHR domain-containing protein [Stenotrophomonas]MBA0338489.1 DGQHR domain-containing protein [Stenotrophomonas maltophilia]MBA0542580.1 DGQHR domain-containing protein [Stenotrophomonas maltophilia]MBH1524880.1 DGQHR domain-containing protein [Stenotrophomonas maltophilia]MBH1574464.1 DGQHR domain-containing protein [Stenotrophomonas maltophilia]MBH1647746.1 DGQHR domain-containing protein [Stenotrophomonas maltophilia]